MEFLRRWFNFSSRRQAGTPHPLLDVCQSDDIVVVEEVEVQRSPCRSPAESLKRPGASHRGRCSPCILIVLQFLPGLEDVLDPVCQDELLLIGCWSQMFRASLDDPTSMGYPHCGRQVGQDDLGWPMPEVWVVLLSPLHTLLTVEDCLSYFVMGLNSGPSMY